MLRRQPPPSLPPLLCSDCLPTSLPPSLPRPHPIPTFQVPFRTKLMKNKWTRANERTERRRAGQLPSGASGGGREGACLFAPGNQPNSPDFNISSSIVNHDQARRMLMGIAWISFLVHVLLRLRPVGSSATKQEMALRQLSSHRL